MGNITDSKENVKLSTNSNMQKDTENVSFSLSQKEVDDIVRKINNIVQDNENGYTTDEVDDQYIDELIRETKAYEELNNQLDDEEISSDDYYNEIDKINNIIYDTLENDGIKRIYINADSEYMINSILGHETTHLFEGTANYKELQKIALEYAKIKNEYDSRTESLENLYKNVKDADIEVELTNDIIGDYLFTDSEFIERLTEKPTIFRKIKNLIDDLVTRFKGTAEEKQLRKLQKKFQTLYQNDIKFDKNGLSDNTKIKYSIQEDSKGKYVNVDLNQDIFKDKTLKEQRNEAKKYIKETFRKNGLLLNNEKVDISRKAVNEYGTPKIHLSENVLADKYKTSTELQELLDVSKYKYSSKDDGRHSFAKDGWDYYETRFKVDNNEYSGLLNIGKNGTKKVLYDITQIKKVDEISQNAESIEPPSTDNISQIDNKVNDDALSTNSNMQNDENNSVKYMMTSIKGMENGIKVDDKYVDIKDRYDAALYSQNKNYSNEEIRQITGWFQDNQGNWEFEISDRNTSLKINPRENTTYNLVDLLKADTLYDVYPNLKDIKVSFKDIKSSGKYNDNSKTITINNKNILKGDKNIRGTLLHEIQHCIQYYEDLPTGTSLLWGNGQYANSKGEIEAADTKVRMDYTMQDRKNIVPESSKESPIHPNRDAILNHKRTRVEKVAEVLYNIFEGDSNVKKNINQSIQETVSMSSQIHKSEIYGRTLEHIKDTDKVSFSLSTKDSQGRELIEITDFNPSPLKKSLFILFILLFYAWHD